MPPPMGIICHICGGKYFKASFPIHLKQCEKKWKQTHAECKKCGQMVATHDWSDHNRHCKKQLSKTERATVNKGPPKAMGIDGRTACLTKEQQAELIEAGSSLPEMFPTGDGLKECKTCGRKFNPDRIEKHQRICFENSKKKKKRKVWDGVKKRLENTDFEQYAGKNRPATPPQIKQWKKEGRRWREEAAQFRNIIHADDENYIPDQLLDKTKITVASLKAPKLPAIKKKNIPIKEIKPKINNDTENENAKVKSEKVEKNEKKRQPNSNPSRNTKQINQSKRRIGTKSTEVNKNSKNRNLNKNVNGSSSRNNSGRRKINDKNSSGRMQRNNTNKQNNNVNTRESRINARKKRIPLNNKRNKKPSITESLNKSETPEEKMKRLNE